MRQRDHTQSEASTELRHVVLAREAILAGMSREQVIETIIKRIRRDEGYLAYRKACGRKTGYDDQVQLDLRAQALAVCWLQETHPAFKTSGP